VATSLRPLGVGEILDAGIKVVTRHWKPLTTAIVGLTVPVWVLFVLVLASIDDEQLELVPEDSGSSSDASTTAIVALGVLGIILLASFAIAFTACFKIVSDAWLGSVPNAKRSLRYGLRRSWKVALLAVVWYIGLILAFVALVIPFFWLIVMWSVSIPVLLFEGGGPFKSLRRSFSLLKGRYWATFALLLVSYLLTSVIATILQYGILGIATVAAGDNTVALTLAQIVGFTLAASVTYPYLAAVLTIMYFDQRVRKEGFDLQLQAEGFGAARDPDAPLPAALVGDEMYTPEQRASAPYWPPPPGWKPPAPESQPSEWASPSGWSAPSPAEAPPSEDARWGSGDPLRSGSDGPPPADPLPPRPDEPEPPPSYPSWSSKPPAGKKKDDDDKPDRGRADWLPPEAPRGPGGL
jgi:hypothetical protein